MKILKTFACFLLLLTATNAVTAQSTNTVRLDGTVLRDGNAFFPLAFYPLIGVPDNPNAATSAQADSPTAAQVQTRIDRLNLLHNAGFNTMYAGVYYKDPTYPALADMAGNYGMILFASPPYLDNGTAAIGKKSAMQVWDVADDADNGTRTPAAIAALAATSKQLAPNQLTYLSLTGYEVWDPNVTPILLTLTDMVALQSYFIGKAGGYIPSDPLLANYELYSTAVDAAAATAAQKNTFPRPIIANVQAFNWKNTGDPNTQNSRPPSPAEGRNLTYGALAAGVKGILYYSLDEGKGFAFDYWYLPTSAPGLWNEYKAVAQDIPLLGSFLLDGDLQKNANSVANSAIITSTWVYQGNWYLIALNTSPSGTHSACIALPGNTTGAPIKVVSRLTTPSSLLVANGNLSFSLPARAVTVYRLAMTSPLSNPNFEQGLTGWTVWSPNSASNDAASANPTGGYVGSGYLSHYKAKAYEVATNQVVTNLPNGKYTLRAWVQRGGGSANTDVAMTAQNYGGAQRFIDIPLCDYWTPVAIRDIQVTNGQCEIGFYSLANANDWLAVDGVEFWKQP